MEYEEGERVKADVIHVSSKGVGYARTPKGKLLLIRGVSDEDDRIDVLITEVLEETFRGKKVEGIGEVSQGAPVLDSPYEIDDEEVETDESEFDEVDDGDTI